MAKDRPVVSAHDSELSRSMSEFDITMIGVGAMIGAGIFVLTGIAAGTTGPSLMLAFVLNGVVTIFTAMVYAELGSAIPEAGGGYLWVKDALGRSQSFLAGWMSWFSHAVAGALYALGFGSFAHLLLERAGVTVPDVPLIGAEKAIGVLIALVFLAINFRGASETSLVGNVVTVAKLVVIGLFIAFGLWAMISEPQRSVDHFTPMFPRGYGNVFLAMGITFVAFEGYEIIVQAGEEVRNPRRAIPRAVFKSLLIVIPIYVLVAIVAIGAVVPEGGQSAWEFLGQEEELGLALAADRFMPYGTVVLLIGGLLSTISALNATTYSSTRVAFAMGRDRVLPASFAKVHTRFKTPYVALAATGAIIVFMVAAIPIADVAAAADVMFLLLFLQVNYAVIRLRNEFGDRLEYGYLMPFYPWVPLIGIVTKAFLAVYLFRFSPLAWFYTLGWILAGIGVFVAYVRGRVAEEDEPRITYEEKPGRRAGRVILAPVANPSHVDTVVRVAAALARARDADLVVLNVIQIPQTLPLAEGRQFTPQADPVIHAVRELDQQLHDVAISTVVGIGRRISKVISTTVEREDAELVVMGWHGGVQASRVRGSVVSEVLRTVHRDVLVLRDNGLPEQVQRVLVGASPGFRARQTLNLAAELAAGFDATLNVLTVTTPGRPPSNGAGFLQDIRDHLADQVPELAVETEAVLSKDVTETITIHASDNDLLTIGASRDWVLPRTLAGTQADELANLVSTSIAMLRPREAKPLSLWRQFVNIVRPRRSPPDQLEPRRNDSPHRNA